MGAEHKQRVVSWDIFDTVIARRCGSPRRLFEIVGKKARCDDFVSRRAVEEHKCQRSGREYALRDIVPETAVVEFQEEINQVFAVKAIAEQIRDDDILVSDMYLSEYQIRDLLEAAGINTKAKIYVSNHGKATGTMWQRLLEQYDIANHVGDNPHGDKRVPETYGIKTVDAGTGFNAVERVYASESEDLAWWVRNHRLQLPSSEPSEFRLAMLQVECNAPLLLAACQDLHDCVTEHGFTKVLFLSRDCCLFSMMWKQLHPDMAAEYIYSSRDCWRGASGGYQEYLTSKMHGHEKTTSFVDLATSTQSMAIGASKMGLGRPCVYTPFHLDNMERRPTVHVNASIKQSDVAVENTYLEMLNYDRMWHVADVAGGKPVFEDEGEYDMQFVEGCHRVFESMVKDAPATRIKNPAMVIEYAAKRIAAESGFLLGTFPGHMALMRKSG